MHPPRFRRHPSPARIGLVASLLWLAGADPLRAATPPAAATGAAPGYAQVRPLLEKRCVVCHACYDAPCQLNLAAEPGIFRGANKSKVYDGSRLSAAEPTRLLIDADGIAEWRELDFFPVLAPPGQDTARQNLADSLLYRMLELKASAPLPMHDDGRLEDVLDLSLNRDWHCPTIEQFDAFAREHRYAGMPFGLPALDDAELGLLRDWIASGPRPGADSRDLAPFRASIDRWEAFLNRADNQGQLVARYVYEHLYLANIHFPAIDTGTWFKLVRSATPPGVPPRRIATRRPYDDPGTARVYYRLVANPGAIVAKTHMPYAFDQSRLARFEQLFFAADYAVDELPSYAPEVASNPFVAFRRIPARQRYRFMLEHAKFTIQGFMKGAVCRGQVALNVIDDHFWVFFASPDNEALDYFDDLLIGQADNLSLPAEERSNAEPLFNWLEFSANQKTYLAHKTRMLNERLFAARPLDETYLWDGDGGNANAALTVFRHFDSASVRRGLLGATPKTAWLIDYPVLERIHYLLVAGFDVYGNVGHQLLTRLYMDFLRMESEFNFLGLLPAAARAAVRDHWYRGADRDVRAFLQGEHARIAHDSDIDYAGDDPLPELFARLRAYLGPVIRDGADLLARPDHAPLYRQLRRLEQGPGGSASLWPESSLLLLDGERPVLFSLLRHSAHSNISGLFDEALRRLPEEDRLEVFPGVVGAYPDAYWRVDRADLAAFVAAARALDSERDYRRLMGRFGVRRSNPAFWAHSDAVHRVYARDYPLDYGLLDYNRLENR